MDLKRNRQVLAKRAQHAQATKSGRMVKSTARKTATAIEKWLDGIAFWKANTAKKRFLKQRKARKAAHLARLERDPKYAKRCAKRLQDQARCYDGINISDRRWAYYAAAEW